MTLLKNTKFYIALFILFSSIFVSSCSNLSINGTHFTESYGKNVGNFILRIDVIDSTKCLIVRQSNQDIAFDSYFTQTEDYDSSTGELSQNEDEAIVDINLVGNIYNFLSYIYFPEFSTYLFVQRKFDISSMQTIDYKILQSNQRFNAKEKIDIFGSDNKSTSSDYYSPEKSKGENHSDFKFWRTADRKYSALSYNTQDHTHQKIYHVTTFDSTLKPISTVKFNPLETIKHDQNSNKLHGIGTLFEKDVKVLDDGTVIMLFHWLSDAKDQLQQLAVEIKSGNIRSAKNSMSVSPFDQNENIKEYFNDIACDSKFYQENSNYQIFSIINIRKKEFYLQVQDIDFSTNSIIARSSSTLKDIYTRGRHSPNKINSIMKHGESYLINLSNMLKINSQKFSHIRRPQGFARLMPLDKNIHKQVMTINGLTYVYLDSDYNIVWNKNFSDTDCKQIKYIVPEIFNYHNPENKQAASTIHTIANDTATARAIYADKKDIFLGDLKFNIKTGEMLDIKKYINEEDRAIVHPGSLLKIDKNNYVGHGIEVIKVHPLLSNSYQLTSIFFHIKKD